MARRITGCFFPEPIEGLGPYNAILIEEDDHAMDLRVCYAVDHVLAAIEDCPDTGEDSRAELRRQLRIGHLPPKSSRAALKIEGWVGEKLVWAMRSDGNIGDEAHEAFCMLDTLCLLYLPDRPEEGQQGFVVVCDEDSDFYVWIVSDREQTRLLLKRFAPSDVDQVAFLQEAEDVLESSTLPEDDDAGDPPGCDESLGEAEEATGSLTPPEDDDADEAHYFDGILAMEFARLFYCLDYQREAS